MKAFIFLNLCQIVFLYAVVGRLLPYLEKNSSFVSGLVKKFSIPRSFSDNYFEECSLDFLETEYLRTLNEL